MSFLDTITNALGVTDNTANFGPALGAENQAIATLEGAIATPNPLASALATAYQAAWKSIAARGAALGWDARMMEVSKQHAQDAYIGHVADATGQAREQVAGALMQKGNMLQTQALSDQQARGESASNLMGVMGTAFGATKGFGTMGGKAPVAAPVQNQGTNMLQMFGGGVGGGQTVGQAAGNTGTDYFPEYQNTAQKILMYGGGGGHP